MQAQDRDKNRRFLSASGPSKHVDTQKLTSGVGRMSKTWPRRPKSPHRAQLRDMTRSHLLRNVPHQPQKHPATQPDSAHQVIKPKSAPRVPPFAPHLRVENHLIRANIAAQERPKPSLWTQPTTARTVDCHNVANCLIAAHKLTSSEASRSSAMVNSHGKQRTQNDRPQSPKRPASAVKFAPCKAKDLLRCADLFAGASQEHAREVWDNISKHYQSNLQQFNQQFEEQLSLADTGIDQLEIKHDLKEPSDRVCLEERCAREPEGQPKRPLSAHTRILKYTSSAENPPTRRPWSAEVKERTRPWETRLSTDRNASSGPSDLHIGSGSGACHTEQTTTMPETRSGQFHFNVAQMRLNSSGSLARSDRGGSPALSPAASMLSRSALLATQDDTPVPSPTHKKSGLGLLLMRKRSTPRAQQAPGTPGLTTPRGPEEQSATTDLDASVFASTKQASVDRTLSVTSLVSATGEQAQLGTASRTQSSKEGAGGGAGAEGRGKGEKKQKSAASKELAARKLHWKHVKEVLTELLDAIRAREVTTAQEMRTYVVRYTAEESVQENALIGLHKALTLPASPWSESDFFLRILPCIIDRALAMTDFFHNGRLPQMRRGQEGRMTVGRAETATVLANMFLCSLPSNDFSLAAVLTSHQAYQIAKIHFFINYFDRLSHLTKDEPGGSIEVAKTLHGGNLDWLRCRRPLMPLAVNFGRAIDERGTLQVMPSHAHIGGGMLYRGRGEEELRMLQYPEVCIAMFVCGVIDDNEAVLVRGAERFSDFEGDDGFTLQFKASFKDKTALDSTGSLNTHILLIDASKFERASGVEDQLDLALMTRDLDKALAGFSESAESAELGPVSTTNWGTDRRFNGASDVRPLLQWMAASVAARELRLWLPADKENTLLRRQLLQLSKQCVLHRITVGQLLHACREARDAYRQQGTLIPLVLKGLSLDGEGSGPMPHSNLLSMSAASDLVEDSGSPEDGDGELDDTGGSREALPLSARSSNGSPIERRELEQAEGVR